MALMANPTAKGNKRSATKEECDKIQQAIHDNDVSTIQRLLDNDIDVINADIVWGEECGKIKQAIHDNDVSTIQQLLDNDIDVINARVVWIRNHLTPLHLAARESSTDIVQLLIDKGADIHAKDEYHQTPLHLAAREGSTDIVQLLIDKEADIHAKDEDNNTPLVAALKSAAENAGEDLFIHCDVISMLLNKGAKVDVKDRLQRTPLHIAVYYNHIDIVKILLTKGANVNAKDIYDLSPLEYAVKRDQRTIVQYLVKENYIDTSQLNEAMRSRIENILEQTNSDNFDEDDGSDENQSGSPDNQSGSHGNQSGSHDNQSKSDNNDSASYSDTQQEVDQLTVEDVNKGYMDGELLGPDVRVALLGAEGSGKTCLSHTLVGRNFQETAPTEGAEHMEIVVESTTNWKPLTHEEKLEDLDKQKCLESISSAAKLFKSQQISSSRSSRPSVSTSRVHVSSGSYVLHTGCTNSFTCPVSCHQSIHSASSHFTDSTAPIIPPGFDPSIFLSSDVSQQAVIPSAKKLKLSSNINDDGSFVSVYAIENLKAFKQSYDPKKKYVNIWDFAGQQVFQHTHGIFVSEEVVCLIVFDAGLALDELPERRYPNDHTPRRTVLETICYWMELISSRVSRPSTSDDDLSILLPTFILVGTHTDKVSYEIYIARDVCFGRFLPIFKKELVGKPFSDHIAGSKNNRLFEEGSPSLFFICNLQWSRDSVVVKALKETVMQAASVTRKTRPTRYVEIERKLMLLSNRDQVGIIGLDEVAKVAKSCGLSTDKEELLKMTQYFHHKGSLLHFHNVPSLYSIVILSPCWLTKLITYVLTSLTCPPTDPVLARFAEKRQNEGLLEEELIHWSVEQFNKTEREYNRIIANLRGIPIIELFTKFQLIVDVTQSSFAGDVLRGEGERLFLVPHLLPFEEHLPSQNFSFKILYNFPAHFIPDNLIDQLIVKCAQWNNDHQYNPIRLSYQWVQFELGKYQTYELRPNYKLDSIELSIIPHPSMPSQYEKESYKDSNELIDAVKEFIDDLMKEHMTATSKKFPVECFIPCPDCDRLHIKLKGFADKGNAYCTNIRSYCSSPMLSRYHKMLSKENITAEVKVIDTEQEKLNQDRPVDYSAAEQYIRSRYDNLALLTISDTLIRRLYRDEVITFDEKIEIQKLDKEDRMEFLLNIIIKSLKLKHSSKLIKLLKIMEDSDDESLKVVATELIFCSFK